MKNGQDLYIGLMSGTSSDAIDAALVQFSNSGCELISTLAAPLDNPILDRIKRAANGTSDRINDISELDALLSQAFASTALRLKAEAGVQLEKGLAGSLHRHLLQQEGPQRAQSLQQKHKQTV